MADQHVASLVERLEKCAQTLERIAKAEDNESPEPDAYCATKGGDHSREVALLLREAASRLAEWTRELPPEACHNCRGFGVLNYGLGENDSDVWVPPYPCPICNRSGLSTPPASPAATSAKEVGTGTRVDWPGTTAYGTASPRVSAATPAPAIDRCDKCGHQPHEPGRCLNMASDNDCNCGVSAATPAPEWNGDRPDTLENIIGHWFIQGGKAEFGHIYDAHRSADGVVARILDVVRAAERPAQTWQPIESAPKDSTVVIGFDPTRDDDDGLPHGVDFMRWFNGCWIDPLTHSLKPTHWMPLPAAPRSVVAPETDK